MLQKSALRGKVIFRACRGRVKIAFPNVVKEAVYAVPLYLPQLRLKPGNQYFALLFLHDVDPLSILGPARRDRHPTVYN